MTTPGEMTDVGLRTEDVVTIQLIDRQGPKDRAPSLLTDLFEVVALLNFRHLAAGGPGRCRGGCLATDRITVDGAPVGYMYRCPYERKIAAGASSLAMKMTST